jgi:hypothetical protein
MPSPLSFSATQLLRNKLLVRNLTPYTKPGVYTPTSSPAPGDLIQNDYSVINSPDVLIDADPFADILYTNNVYGPNGGYNKNINGLINTQQATSNQGPYGSYPPYTNALQDYSVSFQQKVYVKNAYSPNDKVFRYYDIGDIINVQKNASYWDPPSFRPSSYSPFAVLLQEDPNGDNGPASLDSKLAQIGVERGKYSFQQRVNQSVLSQTLGRVNILNGLQDPVQLAMIIAGKRPLIARDYKITSGGGNILSQGQDIVERIAGFTLPFSPIPGSYFQYRDFNSSQSLTRAAGDGKRGGLFGLFGSRPTSPSQLFLDYTGSGQREQLTSNLDSNRYRPKYNTGGGGIISTIGNAITGAFSQDLSDGNYYVGSPTREPEYLTSPAGQVPIDQYGAQVSAPVYGPDILGKEYEGVDKNFKFGLAGRAFEDDGNITGGFTWVSGKWAPNAGRRQKPGGDYGTESPDWPSISDQVTSTESINYEFKPGSILDNTQRLIESQPNSGARFGHVGNAIDQTSKVFFDGYKEITKGSQVIKYSNGQANVGIEYCRVFTKDTPYYSFNDLQKKDGNIRKFSYSVLDSTFNLNIAPEKGGNSVVTTGSNNGIQQGQVKKYLFSVENLAWRTGYRAGYRVSDLPACEQGPNGGRIMWFPPYDMSITEDTRPQFNENVFLGRPEPIYTYRNTSRSGTLKWKMIVDHPSIMDLIVNRVLANEGDRAKADSIINSFFAGCKKYDLYDLAQIYNTVPLTELQAWQEVINNPNVTQEQFKEAVDNVQPTVGTGPQTGGNQTTATPQKTLDSYLNLGFYFDNNIPGTNPQLTTSTDFQSAYAAYTSITNKQNYYTLNPATSGTTDKFFTSVVENNYTALKILVADIYEIITQKQASQVILKLQGSASPPAEVEYNRKLSSRRIDSVLQFLKTYKFDGTNSLGEYVGTQVLVSENAVGEELSSITPVTVGTGSWGGADCTKQTTGKDQIYSTDAMSCRAVIVTNITIIPIQENPQPANNADQQKTLENGQPLQPKKPTPPATQPTQDLYKGASKKLLRYLLNECDYFEVLKQDNPFIYDSIKEKLKYFQPAFHSMTPEGLNSRLTFLQQCARPGETIPTIGPNGEKLYNDALNTSFGAPPVLVLRVGDFFNTKIIPTGINFVYDKTWDMNPEGIGFQPMIVEVNLSFNLVGGMGLKNPIDTLQNALTFNYYANTEMYDERAEATEDTSKLDKQVVDALIRQNPTVGVSNADGPITTDGGNTIGIFVSTGTTASGQTGTLTYGTYMNNLVKQTQSYYDGTLNMFDSVLTNYNYGLLSMLNYGDKNQAYNTGKFNSSTELDVNIYGKPQNTQTFVNDAFKEFLTNIDDGDIDIFTSSVFINPLITNDQKRLFKKNYTNYVNTYRTNFLNGLTTPVNTLSTIQQEYVYNIDRLNFVVSGSSIGYDGKLNKQNIAIIYTLTGTTEDVNGTPTNTLTSLRNDYLSIGGSNNSFLTGLTNANLYNTTGYQPKTPGTWTAPSGLFLYTSLNEYRQREYTLMSRALLQKDLKEGFINALVQGLNQATTNAVKFFYDTSDISLRVQWTLSNNEGKTLLADYKTSDAAKPYIKYTPSFGTTQKRITVFAEELVPPNDKKQTLQNIYSNKNNNGNKTPYNFKRKFL